MIALGMLSQARGHFTRQAVAKRTVLVNVGGLRTDWVLAQPAKKVLSGFYLFFNIFYSQPGLRTERLLTRRTNRARGARRGRRYLERGVEFPSL